MHPKKKVPLELHRHISLRPLSRTVRPGLILRCPDHHLESVPVQTTAGTSTQRCSAVQITMTVPSKEKAKGCLCNRH
jgi:hypothetical protein